MIESKGSQAVSLSWSSVHTPKALIPATSLYPEKANEEFSDVLTPPDLEKKVSLDQVLVSQKKTIDASGKDVFSVTPFDPSEYSIE